MCIDDKNMGNYELTTESEFNNYNDKPARLIKKLIMFQKFK